MQGGTTATVSLGVGANHEEARLAIFDFFEDLCLRVTETFAG